LEDNFNEFAFIGGYKSIWCSAVTAEHQIFNSVKVGIFGGKFENSKILADWIDKKIFGWHPVYQFI